MELPEIHKIDDAATPSAHTTIDNPDSSNENCYDDLMKKFEDSLMKKYVDSAKNDLEKRHGQDENNEIVQTRTISIHNGENTIKPKLVSIGPFFHGDPVLRDMERRKDELLVELLAAAGASILPRLISEVTELRESAQKLYSGNTKLKDAEFAQMLLLDSCFIIKFFLYRVSKDTHGSHIFVNLDVEEIRSDLILMGNQIPFFVVEKLYGILPYHILPKKAVGGTTERCIDIIKPFLCIDKSSELHVNVVLDPRLTVDHLLDLVWLNFIPDDKEIEFRLYPNKNEGSNENERNLSKFNVRNIPSATELNRVAAIIFKHQSSCPIARFVGGNFEMSPFSVDENMKSIVTSLVMYERNLQLHKRKVSSYMMLMNCLIRTEQDLALLQKGGIIVNSQGTNSNTTAFFNEVGKMCIIDHNYQRLAIIFADIDQIYNCKQKGLFEILRRDYCYSPWARVSVAAAVVLLILTVIQTILGGIQTHFTIHPQN